MILYFSMLSEHSVHCGNSRIFHSISDLFFRCDTSAVWYACLSAYVVNTIRDTSSRLSDSEIKTSTIYFVLFCCKAVYLVGALYSTQYIMYSIHLIW